MTNRTPTASERAAEVLPCVCHQIRGAGIHENGCPRTFIPAVTAAIRSAERAAAARVWMEAAGVAREHECGTCTMPELTGEHCSERIADALRARAEAEERTQEDPDSE